MVNEQPKLPEGSDNNKYKSFFNTAEQYEAYGDSVELQLRELKAQIQEELRDEYKRIEYELSQREIAIRKKELELAQREADLDAREARLARIEQFESAPSPKQRQADDDLAEDLDLEELTFPEPERQPYERRPDAKVPGRDYIPNPEGKGGLSSATVIDRSKYQGDYVRLENGNGLRWNQQTKEYDFEFIPGDDPKINANKGLKFTYFAVEAAYLEQGYDNPNFPHLYSQTILNKQVWYERTPHNRKPGAGALGEQYQGRVPFEVLMSQLNGLVNTRRFTKDGKYIENQDIRQAYKNVRVRYERGTYYKTANGELYSVIEPGSQILETKGNPPTYRTDGNFKSPTYGEKVELSTEEKQRWYAGQKGKGSKRRGKK